MTNDWIDVKNSDCILVIGANPAENHPASMGWVNAAREKNGAKLIVVDPRFTRTAATADLYASPAFGHRHRLPGSADQLHPPEQALQRGLRQVLHQRPDPDQPRLQGPRRPRRPLLRLRRREAGSTTPRAGSIRPKRRRSRSKRRTPPPASNETWRRRSRSSSRQTSLDDPNCVFAPLTKHYARYTPEVVEKICGTPTGGLPEGGGDVLRHLLRARQDRHHLLRHGPDPAHRRHSERAVAGHPAAPVGQHRHAGRRRQGPARRVQRPGLDGHGPAVRQAPGLPGRAK